MFRQAILRGHKHRTPRAAVADLQAKDVAIKRHRSFHVLYVKAQMTQRGYFWHKSSLQWTVKLLDGLAGVVNVSAERERTGVMECWSTGVRSYRIAIFTHLVSVRTLTWKLKRRYFRHYVDSTRRNTMEFVNLDKKIAETDKKTIR